MLMENFLLRHAEVFGVFPIGIPDVPIFVDDNDALIRLINDYFQNLGKALELVQISEGIIENPRKARRYFVVHVSDSLHHGKGNSVPEPQWILAAIPLRSYSFEEK